MVQAARARSQRAIPIRLSDLLWLVSFWLFLISFLLFYFTERGEKRLYYIRKDLVSFSFPKREKNRERRIVMKCKSTQHRVFQGGW